MKLGIIASSGGSVFRELCLAAPSYCEEFVVVTDRSCGIEDVCSEFGVKQVRIAEQDNAVFSKRAHDIFDEYKAFHVLLFFTRLITKDLYDPFEVYNIHPSLLPKYPGFSPVKKAFDAREKEFGSTLHQVDASSDGGHIIFQVSDSAGSEADFKVWMHLSFLQKTFLTFLFFERYFLSVSKSNDCKQCDFKDWASCLTQESLVQHMKKMTEGQWASCG